MKKRYLSKHILEDLSNKMVFLGGPRQVGKTTLALALAAENFRVFSYLNWDNRENRRDILRSQFKGDAEILIFDEIHKYKDWKNYLKGIFDTHRMRYRILVTGSTRLDVYRRGGDSLQGRYHYYRLHPFSLSEYIELSPEIVPLEELAFPDSSKILRDAFKRLNIFGGFPEPLLSGKEKTLRRWHNQRTERLVKEDIRDLQNIRELSTLQILADMLPEKVGSLFSINSLREDLQMSHKTISLWIDLLERFYYHFRIYPFSHSRIRSLKKEGKVYLWDWSQVTDYPARLENMVASHLLKLCNYLYDVEGYKANLHFLRDVDGKEVDFLVTVDEAPWLAVEVKTSKTPVSRNLFYFGSRLSIPFLYQVVDSEDIDLMKDSVRIISVERFLGSLP